MLKKFGAVTIGVAAGLAAAAPLASAHESGHDRHHGDAGSSCNVTGGDAEANGGIGGDALAGNLLAQAPVGGANLGNVVCNDILNGNLSGNTADIDIAGSDSPEVPGATPTDGEETDGGTSGDLGGDAGGDSTS